MLSQYSKADAYVREVCAQIRWKKAHAIIEEELLAHIEDQAEVLLAEGVSPTDAEVLAVVEMGSPVETGSRFDRLYRPHIEWSVLLFVGLLLLFGTVVRLALLSAMGEEVRIVQTLWTLPTGLAVLMLGYWLDYTVLLTGGKRKTMLLFYTYLVAYVLITFRFIPLGPVENGAWTAVSYLALFFPPVFCALLYQNRGEKKNGVSTVFWNIILYANFFFYLAKAGAIFLILGSGILIILYALWKNWFGCKRWRGLLSLFCSGTLFVLFLLWLIGKDLVHVVRTNMSPFIDPDGMTAVANQVHDVVQGASWTGSETVELTTLAANIPHFSTNYLLTAMLGHWGWFAVCLVMLAYVALALICCFACSKVKSTFGKIVAMAILSGWIIQVFLYTLTNLTTIQMATFPLLFVQGDVELVCNLFLLGLLLSVFKTGAVETDAVIIAQTRKNKIKTDIFWNHKVEQFSKTMDWFYAKMDSFWGHAAEQFSKGMDRFYQWFNEQDVHKIKK